MSKNEYDDIIDLPHHVSENRQRMPMSDRAAQFAPFSALTGYGATVEEAGRLTSKRATLDEYEKERIDRELRYISENTASEVNIKVVFFVPDSKKSGGAYHTLRGFAERIDEYERILLMSNGTIIPVDDIYSLVIEG